MAQIARLRVNWAGLPGMPGITTWYINGTLDPAGVATQAGYIKTFLTTIAPDLVGPGSWSFTGSVDLLDETNGALTGGFGYTPPANVSMTGVGSYSAPVGLLVKWLTGAVYGGHRISGRSYMVPTKGSMEDATGAPLAARTTAWTTAANTLISSSGSNLLVWSRPRAARAAVPGGPPALAARDGKAFPVTSASVPTKYTVLRSRRD